MLAGPKDRVASLFLWDVGNLCAASLNRKRPTCVVGFRNSSCRRCRFHAQSIAIFGSHPFCAISQTRKYQFSDKA